MYPISALEKERCEGLLLTDYNIHEYILWFESDSIDIIEDEYVDFPDDFFCYDITATKYFFIINMEVILFRE